MGNPYSGLRDFLNIGTTALIIVGVLYLVFIAFYIWAFVRIMKQAGHSPHWAWLFLGFVIPFVNFLVILAAIVLYFIFAFQEWPVRRELRELRAWADAQYQQQSGGGYPQPGGFPQSGGFQQPGQQSGGFPQQGGPQSGGFPPQQGGPQY